MAEHAATSLASGPAGRRAFFDGFVDLMYRRLDVRTAFDTYVAPDYLQHNPGLPDGPDAAVAGLEPKFQRDGARFEVQRILVDGDLAVVHLKASFPGTAPTAVADFYRIADGLLVEHWDVLQPVPAESANAHPMF